MVDAISSPQRPIGMDEAAEYLGISKNYLYQLVSKKEITYYKSKNGRKTSFKLRDLDAWVYARCSKSNSELEEDAARYSLNRKKRR